MQGRHEGQRWQPILVSLCMLLLAGCTVQLIAQYDEATDRATTALQKKVETFFVMLERQIGTPEAAYARHVALYDDVQVELSALKVRAEALPQNSLTVQQIDLLTASWANLQQLHRLGLRSVEEITPLRRNFNQAFTQILKLELAKRRGA